MNQVQQAARGNAARKPRISNDQILEGLRRFAALSGNRAFRCEDFRTWPDRPCTVLTVINRFGSWRKALALVGIEGGRIRTCDAEELMTNLERIWHELGHRPGAHELRWRGRFGPFPYRARWGSVRRACQLLSDHRRGRMTREALLRPRPDERRSIRAKLPLEIRWTILKRDRYRCAACGKSPATQPGIELEVDHILPVCRGGTNHESNLRTLCNPCNQGKKGGE